MDVDKPRFRAAGLYELAARIHADARYDAGFSGYRDQMAFRHSMQCAWSEIEKAGLVRSVPGRAVLEAYRCGGPEGTDDFTRATEAAQVAWAWLTEAKAL